ncbi:MAG: hypothetical protein Q8T11_06145 [Elusimicrobiota bacterium]|nr:hypothetical protein [Elusimicrobiota bacterium]
MKTQTKKKTSKKRHPAASRSKSHRKSLRRGNPSRMKKAMPVFTPVLIEETIIERVGGETPLEYGGERPGADKRDEELSDEEILDREEKQHLY